MCSCNSYKRTHSCTGPLKRKPVPIDTSNIELKIRPEHLDARHQIEKKRRKWKTDPEQVFCALCCLCGSQTARDSHEISTHVGGDLREEYPSP